MAYEDAGIESGGSTVVGRFVSYNTNYSINECGRIKFNYGGGTFEFSNPFQIKAWFYNGKNQYASATFNVPKTSELISEGYLEVYSAESLQYGLMFSDRFLGNYGIFADMNSGALSDDIKTQSGAHTFYVYILDYTNREYYRIINFSLNDDILGTDVDGEYYNTYDDFTIWVEYPRLQSITASYIGTTKYYGDRVTKADFKVHGRYLYPKNNGTTGEWSRVLDSSYCSISNINVPLNAGDNTFNISYGELYYPYGVSGGESVSASTSVSLRVNGVAGYSSNIPDSIIEGTTFHYSDYSVNVTMTNSETITLPLNSNELVVTGISDGQVILNNSTISYYYKQPETVQSKVISAINATSSYFVSIYLSPLQNPYPFIYNKGTPTATILGALRSSSQIVIKAKYNSELSLEDEVLDDGDYTISLNQADVDTNLEHTINAIVAYHTEDNRDLTCTIPVYVRTLKDFRLIEDNSKSKEFFVGSTHKNVADALTPTAQVVADINGSEETINLPYNQLIVENGSSEFSQVSNNSTITLSYTNYDQTVYANLSGIVIKDPTITSISLSTNNEWKTEYYYNREGFNVTGLTIVAHYDDGSTKVISPANENLSHKIGTPFENSDSNIITATYKGFYASINITLKRDSIVGIETVTDNVQVHFTVGEIFNVYNLRLKLIYDSDYEEIKEVENLGLSSSDITGVSVGHKFVGSDYNLDGNNRVETTKIITVSYANHSATYSISLKVPQNISYNFDTSSAYTTVTNNTISLENFIASFNTVSATINYGNDYSEKILFSSGKISFNFNNANGFLSDNKIYASSFNNGASQFNITAFVADNYGTSLEKQIPITIVPNKKPIAISVNTPANIISHISGEEWTGDNLTVKVVFTDTEGYTTYDITAPEIETIPAINDKLAGVGIKTIPVTFTYNGTVLTTSFDMQIIPSYAPTTEEEVELKVVKLTPRKFLEYVNDYPNEFTDITFENAKKIAEDDNKVWTLVAKNDTEIVTNERVIKSTSFNPVIYGYVLLGKESEGVTVDVGKVVLLRDYPHLDAGESNIEVEFPRYFAGYEEAINECTIGKIFGNANAKNRLFLSGNSYGIRDYYSGDTGTTGDFSYFGDADYNDYGQTDNKVIGYDIVSTDQMIVLKSQSYIEPTNYYRSNGLRVATDASGNEKTSINGNNLYEEAYKCLTGNVGIGALSNKGICNFNGDTLYIGANKTICGLDIIGQVANSQRIANSRSRYIDEDLNKYSIEQLTNSELFTDNSYLYLVLPDCVYITHIDMFDATTKQYEWWKVDIKDIQSIIFVDGVTYFGDSNGSFYRMNNGKYADLNDVFVGAGGAFIAHTDANSEIIYNSAMEEEFIRDSKYKFEFINRGETSSDLVYYSVCSIGNSEEYDLFAQNIEGRVVVKIVGGGNGERAARIIARLGESGTMYFADSNKVVRTGKSYKYRVYKNQEDLYYYLEILGGIVSSEIGNYIAKPFTGEWEVVNLDNENHSFQLVYGDDSEEIVDILTTTQAGFKAKLHMYTPVKAYYITAPYTAGSLSYNKTLWSWTLTDTSASGYSVDVCLATNDEAFDDLRTEIVGLGASTTGFDYNSQSNLYLDYDKIKLPRSVSYVRPLTSQYFCFAFKNFEAEPSALFSLTVTYSVPGAIYGLK